MSDSHESSSVVDKTEDIFMDAGALARAVEGYEERPQQAAMAVAVADAFDNHERLMVEAATGTGKTLAYLVPAILSGKRTLVSTATKNLQEQIFGKDLPLLERVLDEPFNAVYLKGRQNYLCLWQWEDFSANPRFRRKQDAHYWPAIERWVGETKTGDRAEIDALPDDYPTWSDLTIGSESCTGRECRFYGECFVMQARRKAQEADVIVVNHHLFFADLSVRRGSHAELLPPYDAVVFDEAHHLENTAAGFFGVSVSNYRIADLLGDIVRFLQREGGLSKGIDKQIRSVRTRNREFFESIGAAVGGQGSRVASEEVFTEERAPALFELHSELENALIHLRALLEIAAGEAGEVAKRLADRADTIIQELALLVGREASDLAYMIEARSRAVFLIAHPIDLSSVLRDVLYGTCDTQVYTSATLTTDGTFGYFRKRMGMPATAGELALEPVFDYMRQSILYVPEHLPEPNDPMFVDKLAEDMRRLVEISEGRAFLLFTSYRNMNRAYQLIAPKLNYTCFIQGQKSRTALLNEFRADTHSVLFATSSFWEGVDVQGESLSLVVIDKLPFQSPFDPLIKARLAHIEEEGGSPFNDYQVPHAIIDLKQGFGRLIRHRDDTGIVAVLDKRLLKRGYGRRFLNSLPRARRTQSLDVVADWWNSRQAESLSSSDDSPDAT